MCNSKFKIQVSVSSSSRALEYNITVYMLFIWSVLCLIVALVAVLAISLLIIYSGAPSIFQKVIENEEVEASNISGTFPLVSQAQIIFRPHEFARGFMNIHSIEEKYWLILDRKVLSDMRNFASLLSKPFTFMVSPEHKNLVYDAAIETLDLIIEHAHKYFGGYVIREGNVVKNQLTNQRWLISSKEKCISCDVDSEYSHPLLVARSLVGEDLNIMIRCDGIHILAASVLLFPDDWKLEEKIGLPLAAIHYPVGVLNTFKETLVDHGNLSRNTVLRAMEFFFDKLYRTEEENEVSTESKLYCRSNWTFQHHPNMSNRFHGPVTELRESLMSLAFTLIGNPLKEIQFRAYLRTFFLSIINWIRQTPVLGLPPLEVKYRSERQTLRLLPKSQCVLFTIHTQVTPIARLLDSQERAEKMVMALRTDITPKDTRNKTLYKEEVSRWILSHYNIESSNQ